MKEQSPSTVVNHTAQVLGTNFTFSSRAGTAFNRWASSPTPKQVCPCTCKTLSFSFLFFLGLRKSCISPRKCSPCVVSESHLPSTLSMTILTKFFPCFKQAFHILKAHLNFYYRFTYKIYIQILSKPHGFTDVSVWHFSYLLPFVTSSRRSQSQCWFFLFSLTLSQQAPPLLPCLPACVPLHLMSMNSWGFPGSVSELLLFTFSP